MLKPRHLAFAACTALVCLANQAGAGPITLDSGQIVNAPAPETIDTSGLLTSTSTSFTTAPAHGDLSVSVYNNSSNPLGGLTFVYSLSNASDSTAGITFFTLNGWTGYNLQVDLGNAPTGGVNPKTFERSSDGDSVFIDFPPDAGAPPIFSGETSYQLVIYTNASSYTSASSYITATDNLGDHTATVQTYAASGPVVVTAVPDTTASAVLVILGLVALAGMKAMQTSARRDPLVVRR